VFSPDSRRIAAPVKRNGRWGIISNGQSAGSYDLVKDPVWSGNSRRLSYVVKRGEEWRVALDGAPEIPFGEIGQLAWSPDGRRLAYSAKRWGKWWVVIGREVGHESHAVWGPVFDGNARINFIARRGSDFYRVTLDLPPR
jgi:hypothetical protein